MYFPALPAVGLAIAMSPLDRPSDITIRLLDPDHLDEGAMDVLPGTDGETE